MFKAADTVLASLANPETADLTCAAVTFLLADVAFDEATFSLISSRLIAVVGFALPEDVDDAVEAVELPDNDEVEFPARTTKPLMEPGRITGKAVENVRAESATRT